MVQHGTVQVNSEQGSWEIARDDEINNCDLPLCYSAVKGAETSVTVASGLPESGLLLAAPRANCPRGRMEQGSSWKCENTHRIYNGKTHTQNRHAQYDILFSYQAASVSWSLRRLTSSIEPRRRNILLFINAHLPRVRHRETQVHSFISPHSNNYKHLKDVGRVLDSLHGQP